jgi:hypothetical protein
MKLRKTGTELDLVVMDCGKTRGYVDRVELRDLRSRAGFTTRHVDHALQAFESGTTRGLEPGGLGSYITLVDLRKMLVIYGARLTE